MKTAVVHDWLNGMRGGEKVLEAILPLLPDPTVFTLFHVAGSVSPAIERYPIRASSLNRLPFARRGYRNYLPLFARAVEAFDLSGFDFVVSSSHCVAKGAIASPGVPHLCYCHTPVRYAWDQFDEYFPEGTPLRGLKRFFVERLREWDRRTAGRPTRYLANSSAVAERIRRHYGREAKVCHPPVDVEFFSPSEAPRGDFLLSVGALVPYKRFGDAVVAAKSLGRPLVLVGRGPEEKRLRVPADSSVNIVADRTPEELRELYRTCAAFVQPGEEDFGIAAVEALACGAPVIALSRGGALDIVEDGRNGVLFTEDGAEGLAKAIGRAESLRFDPASLRAGALRFSADRFRAAFSAALPRAGKK
ncbi:MAG TPA: glycosyltransferase [Thermoanaerobaculia bacterium]|nr:glycosyltransferase [Thermoanaerobaculia bacterium]